MTDIKDDLLKSASSDPEVVLEARHITKRFPGVLANDQVDLQLRRGEILALLGENGAGKSTLMNIIYGLYHQDEGEIYLKGREMRFASPREAIHSGIGMVHQHFQLIDVMTVAENVVLGEEKEFPSWRTLTSLIFVVGVVIGIIELALRFELEAVYDALLFLLLGVLLPLFAGRIVFDVVGFVFRLFKKVRGTPASSAVPGKTQKRWVTFAAQFGAVLAMIWLANEFADNLKILSTIGMFIVAGGAYFLSRSLIPRLSDEWLTQASRHPIADDHDRAESRAFLQWNAFTFFSLFLFGVWFVWQITSFGELLELVAALLVVIALSAGVAFVGGYLLSQIFSRWTSVTAGLRIIWGSAWRLGLIFAAFYIASQAEHITRMGIIASLLQNEVPFRTETTQQIGTMGVKIGEEGSEELSISWRRIERAATVDEQIQSVLALIDEEFAAERTVVNREEDFTTAVTVTGYAGINPVVRQAVDDVPPVAGDIVAGVLLVLFVLLAVRSWRGWQLFPQPFSQIDILCLVAIVAIFAWQLITNLDNISDGARAGFLVALLVAGIGGIFWTYRLRAAHHERIRPISPPDIIADGFSGLLYTLFSVRNVRAAARRVRDLSRQYSLEVDPDAPIEKLPVGAQQRVEIIKALYRNADILILDEPTAVLTPQESQELFKIMRGLSAQGVSIIFITHKLKEVFEVATRIVVMRGGRVVGSTTPKEATQASLAEMMVGREVMLKVEKTDAVPGEAVLSVSDLHAKNDRGAMALNGVNFEVYAGEVLGIAGVQGNGQTELVEVLTGLRHQESGDVNLMGMQWSQSGVTPRKIKNLRTAHVPEDRFRYGLVKPFTVAENLVLNDYYEAPYAQAPNPVQLFSLSTLFWTIFALVFIVLGYLWLDLWESQLWYDLLDDYNVPAEIRTVPIGRGMSELEQAYLNDPLLISLIALMAATAVFSLIAFLCTRLILRFLYRPPQFSTMLVATALGIGTYLFIIGGTGSAITDHIIAAVIAAGVVIAFGVLRPLWSRAVDSFLAGLGLSPAASSTGGLALDLSSAANHAEKLIKEFDIRTPSPMVSGGSLSGGNQQKLVVAREFSRQPRLLVAAQPTRGIDVGSIEFIHNQIVAQRDAGAAVLLVSAELDEIMSLSDRIAVMYKGRVIDTVDAKTATREQLGLLMAGIK